MLAALGGALSASALELPPLPAAETANPPIIHHRTNSDVDGLLHVANFGQENAARLGTTTIRLIVTHSLAFIESMELPALTVQQQALAVTVASVAPPRAEALAGNHPSFRASLTERADLQIASASEMPRLIEMRAGAAFLVHTADVRALPNIRLLASSRGGAPLVSFSPLYISYVGGAAGPSAINSIKGQPDSTAVVAGTMSDPVTGVNDLLVAKISSDGSSLVGMALIGSPDGSVSLSGTGADQDNVGDGAIYFNGTATNTDNSGSAMVYGRIEPDFSGLGWGGQTFTFSGVTAGNGAKVSNGNLYFSGNATDSNSGLTDVFVARISNLQDDPTQVTVTGAAYGFQDANGNPIATTGLNVSGDVTGSLISAGSYSNSDLTDTEAFSVHPSPDFLRAYGFGLSFLPGAPNLGSFTSVDIDSANIVYAVGSINVSSGTGSSHFDIAFSKFNIETGQSYYSDGGAVVGARLFGSPGADFFGTGNHGGIGGIQAGNGYLVAQSDPLHLGVEFLMRVNATGDPLDGQLLGVPGGSGDDRATGMDIAPDIFTGGDDYYLAGYTNSTDFATTPGAYQESYPGDPNHPTYQGWVADGIVG